MFYHNWQSCPNLIGQFALVDKSTDNAARVNVSPNAFISAQREGRYRKVNLPPPYFFSQFLLPP